MNLEECLFIMYEQINLVLFDYIIILTWKYTPGGSGWIIRLGLG